MANADAFAALTNPAPRRTDTMAEPMPSTTASKETATVPEAEVGAGYAAVLQPGVYDDTDGKYQYEYRDGKITILRSPRGGAGTVLESDSPFFDAIVKNIQLGGAKPATVRGAAYDRMKATPKAAPAAERARVAAKPAPSAAPPSMAEPDITMDKPVAEDYADQLLDMPQGGALAEERNAAKPAMAGMGGRSGISKQIGEAMSSVGNFLEGTQMGRGAMARPMSTRISEGAAAFDKAATATKMGTRPGISSEIKQAASGMIHAQKMRDAVTAASGALVRMDMSPMDANRVANQLAKANDLATLERLAKLK